MDQLPFIFYFFIGVSACSSCRLSKFSFLCGDVMGVLVYQPTNAPLHQCDGCVHLSTHQCTNTSVRWACPSTSAPVHQHISAIGVFIYQPTNTPAHQCDGHVHLPTHQCTNMPERQKYKCSEVCECVHVLRLLLL